MLINLLKKIIVKSWEYHMKRNLLKKFKLYGPYKKMYKWDTYKFYDIHKNLFSPLNYKVNRKWYEFFTLIRQEENPAYLPEDIWHLRIEPALNNRAYNKAFNDKNLFDLNKYQYLFPKTYLHVIQGICYSPTYKMLNLDKAIDMLPIGKPFVVKKATDSGGGKGVHFYESYNKKLDIKNIIKKHGEDIIFQELVEQHPWFAQFNPTSLNTIRVITYRSVVDEKIHILQTLLRMGKPGSKVDNQSSGGIACGIDKFGKLNNRGYDKLSNRFTEVNGIQFSKMQPIPNFDLLKKTCMEIARERPYERILVFDTWQDLKNNIRLVEINNINIGIEDLQKNNGPFLGKYTDEIIQWCATHSRNYCFDFRI